MMKKKIVLYGDSILNAAHPYFDVPCIKLSVPGNKTLELIGNIVALVRENPTHIIILIGINDVLLNAGLWQDKMTINIQETYRLLLALIHENLPKTRVHTVDILPIRDVLDAKTINEVIDSTNQTLKKLSSEYGFKHLSINSTFKDSDNLLIKDYTTDGIHLNALGNQKLVSMIAW